MTDRFPAELIEHALSLVGHLRDDSLAHAERHAEDVESAAPEHRPSAENLLHYLALRQHDLRELQERLSRFGLSSLSRSEARTLEGLDSILANLQGLARRPGDPADAGRPWSRHGDGDDLLRRNADTLLGPPPEERETRIMVTMPGAASTDPDLVRSLVAAGMDVMRVNTAHDGVEAWEAMADRLDEARNETRRPCSLQVDLAGPKVRTGALEGGDRIVHWRPKRDLRGGVAAPARVLVVASRDGVVASGQGVDAAAVLPVSAELLESAQPGDCLRLNDVRGRKPELHLLRRRPGGAYECEGSAGAYVETGGRVRLRREGTIVAEGRIGLLPAAIEPIELEAGDRLVLTRSAEPGHRARRDEHGALLEPATIPCTLPEVFADARPGHRIWLDDGKFGGLVREVDAERLVVEITHAPPAGAKLRPAKGINLPDTPLHLPALTERDLDCLDFAVRRADLVGMSFVRTREDVEHLMKELDRRDARHLGIVLKVETQHGFQNLPDLLLTGLRWPRLGVMVARGDLAVEVGFERLAEVQEEMLWLCEAAHVPIVWATQVLETLAQRGLPSRAEVTDAAMSERAECVMLNKGPHVVDAVTFLDDVLRRMQQHQQKKNSMLRPLSVSHVHAQTHGA